MPVRQSLHLLALLSFLAKYVPGVRTGTAGWGVGHSRSRQGTRTGLPGHCWRRWCLTGWARAVRGDTWRFLWAARWQSGDSFLIKRWDGHEDDTISNYHNNIYWTYCWQKLICHHMFLNKKKKHFSHHYHGRAIINFQFNTKLSSSSSSCQTSLFWQVLSCREIKPPSLPTLGGVQPLFTWRHAGTC